jgi:hypothetical protein
MKVNLHGRQRPMKGVHVVVVLQEELLRLVEAEHVAERFECSGCGLDRRPLDQHVEVGGWPDDVLIIEPRSEKRSLQRHRCHARPFKRAEHTAKSFTRHIAS